MFGEGFENCWYKIPGVPSLELSGDLSFGVLRGSASFASTATGGRTSLATKVANHESRAEYGKAR